jgi:hypothetical protein
MNVSLNLLLCFLVLIADAFVDSLVLAPCLGLFAVVLVGCNPVVVVV